MLSDELDEDDLEEAEEEIDIAIDRIGDVIEKAREEGEMKDYTYLKSEIRIPSGREAELDELLGDTELMPLFEKMCIRSGAELPIYIQFLMEQEAPGKVRLHELAEMVLAHAIKSRPEMFME